MQNFYKEMWSDLSIRSFATEKLSQILEREKLLHNSVNEYAEIVNEMAGMNKAAVFSHHDQLVSYFFGNPKNVFAFKLTEDRVEELSAWLSKMPTTTFEKEVKNQNGPLFAPRLSTKGVMEQLDQNLIPFSLTNCEVIQGLHKEIRSNISEQIGSPFAFINTRAWVTKSLSNEMGPNAPHKDGFLPGHMKIMVYLTPMSAEYGDFWIEGEQITGEKPGFCIGFKNSDLLHSGKPGTKYPRICIEVTIMRTLQDNKQSHDSHVCGRHFLNVSSAYENLIKQKNCQDMLVEELLANKKTPEATSHAKAGGA